MSHYANQINKAILLNEELETLLEKFPRQRELDQASAEMLGKNYDGTYNKVDPVITVETDSTYGGAYQVVFLYRPIQHHSPTIKFCLDLYPYCCALHQLNNFSCSDKYLDQEFFEAFIQMAFGYYKNHVNKITRLMINFVEFSRATQFDMDDKAIPLDEKSEIQYPTWYKWAKNRPAANVIETLFVNNNTDRVIHNTIITL
jgi:hypothetical protein